MKASNLLLSIVKYFNENSEDYEMTLRTMYQKSDVFVTLVLGDGNDEIILASVSGDNETLDDIYKEILDTLLEYNLTYLKEYYGLE